jgi:hypothetical protein
MMKTHCRRQCGERWWSAPQLLFVALALAFVWFAFWILGPRVPAVQVDYLEKVAGLSRPSAPAEDGWSLYQEILADLPGPPDRRLVVPEDHDHYPEMIRWALDNQSLLPTLLKATARESYGQPPCFRPYCQSWIRFWNGRGVSTKANQYREWLEEEHHPAEIVPATYEYHSPRQMVQLLLFSARVTSQEGLRHRALELAEGCLRLGQQVARRATCIDAMDGLSFVRLALQEASQLFWRHRDHWTEEDWSRIRESPLMMAGMPSAADLTLGSWYSTLGYVQAFFADDSTVFAGFAFGYLSREQLGPLWPLCHRLHSRLHVSPDETLQRLWSLREEALAGRSKPRARPHFLQWHREALIVAGNPVWGVNAVRVLREAVDRQSRGAQIARALTQYFQRTGDLPADFENLSPEWEDGLPPTSGFSYSPADSGRLLVDLGSDGCPATQDDVVLMSSP